jgi:hypothetical protein
MKYSYSHVILYCKSWYEKTNTIDDLKIILGVRNGVKPKHIDLNIIWNALFSIIWDYYVKGEKYKMIEIFSDFFRWKKEMIVTIEEMIQIMVNKISIIQIKDDDKILIDLDRPDYTILSKHEMVTQEFEDRIFGVKNDNATNNKLD